MWRKMHKSTTCLSNCRYSRCLTRLLDYQNLKEAYTVTTTAEPSCLSPSFTVPKIWYQMQYISLSNVRVISVDLWKAEEPPDEYGAQLKLKDAICHWRAITSAPAVVSFFCCCLRLFYYFIFLLCSLSSLLALRRKVSRCDKRYL